MYAYITSSFKWHHGQIINLWSFLIICTSCTNLIATYHVIIVTCKYWAWHKTKFQSKLITQWKIFTAGFHVYDQIPVYVSCQDNCFTYNISHELCTLFALWCQGPLILIWISQQIHYKVLDEITYPFPNFNGCTIDVWEWISDFIQHFTSHVFLLLFDVGITISVLVSWTPVIKNAYRPCGEVVVPSWMTGGTGNTTTPPHRPWQALSPLLIPFRIISCALARIPLCQWSNHETWRKIFNMNPSGVFEASKAKRSNRKPRAYSMGYTVDINTLRPRQNSRHFPNE